MIRTCLLNVGVIGINFKTAPLSLREKIAKAAASLSGEKSLFFRHPTVHLSTCNRTEIYFSSEDLTEAHNNLLTFLRGKIDGPFEQNLYSFFGYECFKHLCRVSSGLDSAILAETEIQRQVKMAYSRSREFLALPSSFHYIFQKSFRVSKEVRSKLIIDRNAPTLFGTIWSLAKEKFVDLEEKKILLIGYSEINRKLALFLERKGCKEIIFCSRDSRVQKKSIPREKIASWVSYDLIVTATHSENYLISGLSQKKHLIFDLSVPRNVNPKVAKEGKIELYNIEMLDQQIEEKRVAHKDTLENCEEWIEEHVLRLSRLYKRKVQMRFNDALEL